MDDRHVSANCPLLKDLNLKLISGPPPAATSIATTPAPGATAASPSEHLAMAGDSSTADLTGQRTAPSGLVTTLTEEEFAFEEVWHWEGDVSGLD
jgi:hypothetical protein